MSERIQLQRTKGWRKPEGAIVVSRPSKWGNPFKLSPVAHSFPSLDDVQVAQMVVVDFRSALTNAIDNPWTVTNLLEFRIMAETLDELAGHDLACWCPLTLPCHADVLLELANA